MRISDWSSDVCSSDLASLVFLASADKAGNEGLGRGEPACVPPQVIKVDLVQLPYTLHPVSFIGIIASAEVDPGNLVSVDYMPEHRMAEQSSGRSGPGFLPLGKFVDERDTVFHCPALRRHRQPVAPGTAHPQMAGLALLLGYRATERHTPCFRLP